MEADSENDDWKSWFQEHGPRLLLCARLWTHCREEAEDAVQEGFVRYWRHQRNLGGNPFPLVVTSIRRAAIDQARARDRRASRERKASDDTTGQDPLFERDELTAAMDDAVTRLPAPQRETLVLKIWGELTFEQIGAQLGISPDTAASRYRYAMATLRRQLIPAREKS